jgi:hypothetical protein
VAKKGSTWFTKESKKLGVADDFDWNGIALSFLTANSV